MIAVDTEYQQEARKLLFDEFICFSDANIGRVLEKCEYSYTSAWHLLHEAECEGANAKFPVEELTPPRENGVLVTQIEISSIKSSQLQAELRKVVEQWNKNRREFAVWASGLMYSKDQDGNEQLLDADGQQVMMEWERPYMERCVDALRIDSESNVLEIGFGCAYSADQIQLKQPRSHTIVECSPVVLERLHAWASTRPNVKIVEGTWQERLPDLGIFDCIFFDDFGEPGVAEREMEDSCPDPTYRAEYTKALNAERGTHFHAFLNIVTRWHARVGTRMSGYLHHPIEMHRDDLEATYQHMDITVPDHCNYFVPGCIWPYALVPLFIKRDPGFDGDRDTTAGSENRSSRSPSASPSWDGDEQRSRGRSRSRSRRGSRSIHRHVADVHMDEGSDTIQAVSV
jgi:hypothetical protein